MELRSICARFMLQFVLSIFVFYVFTVEATKDSSVIDYKFISDEKPHDTILQLFVKSFDPENGIVSSECQRDNIIYRKALSEYKPWALQMYDSSTKIPSGLITGNYKQLGNYDECLRIKSDNDFVGKACNAQVRFTISDNDDNPTIDGNLDMGDLLINVALASGLTNWTSGESVPFEWLWCVPSSCNSRDISEAIEFGLDPLKQSSRVDFVVTVGNDSCHTEESDRAVYDLADWLYISLLILFGIIIIASTTYDMKKLRSSEKPDPKDIKHTIFSSFSVYKNGKSFLNTRRGNDTIACLDGLRFLSICWIIYGHTHYLAIVGVNLDLSHVSTMHENWANLLLLNGTIVTDTFLLLSGILLAYTEMGRKIKDPAVHRLSIWNLYIHRYLRLTPAYAIVIGFYATLFYKIGNGPHWNTWVGANRDFCINNWWTNLLYVNNYVNVSDMCMSQSWYLSVDMQLIWLSPIFLYPMLGDGKKNQRIFVALLSIGFLGSILAPLFVTYFNDLTGTMLYYKDQKDVGNVYLQIYTRVYARAGPYFLGLGLGYYLRKINPNNSKMPITFVLGGWTIAIITGLAVIFGPRGMYFANHNYDSVEAAFYAGFHRPVFALAVGWIVVASVFGCAGPVGALLSWSGWVPLSKLTYSAYLTHYIILLYNAGIVRTPGSLTTFGVVQTFFGNLAMTLIISTILCLSFEMPFVKLDRLLLSGKRRISFTSASFEPKILPFGAWDSSREIYRSIEDLTSTVSRTYKDLIDRYAKVSITSQNSPPLTSDPEINSPLPGGRNFNDFDDSRRLPIANTNEASSSREVDPENGIDNPAFEKF